LLRQPRTLQQQAGVGSRELEENPPNPQFSLHVVLAVHTNAYRDIDLIERFYRAYIKKGHGKTRS
jgi:hypothetical protein